MEWIHEIELHFGKQLSKFAKAVYLQKLQVLTESEIQTAVANCICKYSVQYGFFPSPDLLLELARGDRPRENAGAYRQRLPSAEMKMTAEECAANKDRLREMLIGVHRNRTLKKNNN